MEIGGERDPFSATVAEVIEEVACLPLTCVVKGSASFPTIIVRDIQVEGAKLGCTTSAVWAHFSISSIEQNTADTTNKFKVNSTRSPHQTYSYSGTPASSCRTPRQPAASCIDSDPDWAVTSFFLRPPTE